MAVQGILGARLAAGQTLNPHPDLARQDVYDRLVAREKRVRSAEANLADAKAENLRRLRAREDEIVQQVPDQAPCRAHTFGTAPAPIGAVVLIEFSSSGEARSTGRSTAHASGTVHLPCTAAPANLQAA